MYSFNNTLYRYTFRPIRKVYNTVTPKIFRTATGNVLANIGSLPNMTNDILQGNRHLFWSDLKRFFFNTTLGGLGLIDVSTKAKIYSHPQSFGYTLVKWGMPEGSFFMLPIKGPSTTTGATGEIADYFMYPIKYIDLNPKSFNYLVWGLVAMDETNRDLPVQDMVSKDAIDPYIALRSAYMQNDAYNIRFIKHDGQIPETQEFKRQKTPEYKGSTI